MKTPTQGKLLRIFISESDRYDGKPLHEAIMNLACKKNLTGCTVLKGFEGFGANSLIHTTKILRLSEELPLILEIVDTADNIDQFLPELDQMIDVGLVTLESVTVLIYKQKPDA